MKYLVETNILPRYLRLDKGTETGKMCTIHAYLVDKLGLFDDPVIQLCTVRRPVIKLNVGGLD